MVREMPLLFAARPLVSHRGRLRNQDPKKGLEFGELAMWEMPKVWRVSIGGFSSQGVCIEFWGVDRGPYFGKCPCEVQLKVRVRVGFGGSQGGILRYRFRSQREAPSLRLPVNSAYRSCAERRCAPSRLISRQKNCTPDPKP